MSERDAAAPSTRAPGDRRRRLMVLAVMCVALTVVVGMLVSLAVTLPDLARDLRATGAQLQWVMNAYGVVFAGLLFPGGAIGDRYGRKGVLLVGLLIFGVASAAVLWVDSVTAVIALRALAGVGAGLIVPMTLSIISSVFPPTERGQAIGVWSGVFVGGGLLGVFIAGGLLEWFSWRSLFAFNIVLVVVALAGTAKLTPTSRDPHATPLDLPGTLLSVVAVSALVFAIVEGPERGWDAPPVLAGFATAALSVAVFTWWELRTPRPLLDLRVFRSRGVSAGSLTIMAESLVAFGVFFLLLQYLQEILDYSPLAAGLGLLPLAIAMIVLSPGAPRLAYRYGLRPVIGAGMVLIAAGLGVMSRIDGDSGFGPVLGGSLLIGAGVALAATPATNAIVASLPAAKQGIAAALNDVTRELGAVLGIAILGSVFNTTYSTDTAQATQQLPAEAAQAARDAFAAALQIAERIGGQPGAQLAQTARDAFSAGMSSTMLAGVVTIITAGIVAILLLPGRAATRAALDSDR